MKITVPVKSLSINQAFQGRRFKSSKYVDFCRDVCKVLPFAKKTIKGECMIDYTFYESNYKMSDVDNRIKTMQDMLVNLNYIADDKQIIELRARKKQCKKGEEKIIIEIVEL